MIVLDANFDDENYRTRNSNFKSLQVIFYHNSLIFKDL